MQVISVGDVDFDLRCVDGMHVFATPKDRKTVLSLFSVMILLYICWFSVFTSYLPNGTIHARRTCLSPDRCSMSGCPKCCQHRWCFAHCSLHPYFSLAEVAFITPLFFQPVLLADAGATSGQAGRTLTWVDMVIYGLTYTMIQQLTQPGNDSHFAIENGPVQNSGCFPMKNAFFPRG